MDTQDSTCPWAGTDPLYRHYHDTEWGIPQHDDRKLFELLTLEGMQAGLSWLIVLRKREYFRVALDGFDPAAVAAYQREQIDRLMQNAGIIRNRRKLEASVTNAQAFLRIQAEFGSFDRYLWSWVGERPIINQFNQINELPAHTELSDRMSRDLISRGFKFVGSTICYALMQSAGLVCDHLASCSCHPANQMSEENNL
jgi:DNA-3-methyladenine glycosylase I